MTAFALRGLLGRKLRTVLTAVAIVLGVATVSGTYVLTDSINNAFHSIFYETRAGSDAVISGESPFDVSQIFRTINGRLAHAEQIEVRTIDDRDPHVFFNPTSQALNC